MQAHILYSNTSTTPTRHTHMAHETENMQDTGWLTWTCGKCTHRVKHSVMTPTVRHHFSSAARTDTHSHKLCWYGHKLIHTRETCFLLLEKSSKLQGRLGGVSNQIPTSAHIKMCYPVLCCVLCFPSRVRNSLCSCHVCCRVFVLLWLSLPLRVLERVSSCITLWARGNL